MPFEGFLLGMVVMASVASGVFFLRFWRSSRDILFLAFAAFFLIEAGDRIALMFSVRPNEGSTWIYVVRLLALILLLGAILHKNYGGRR